MEHLIPDYIFETSWEVCNKVGGIYAVLSTRARILQERFGGRLVFIGPDIWKDRESPYFSGTSEYAAWATDFKAHTGIGVRVGRWEICGRPTVFLVDFTPLYERKNSIYADMWERFSVDSLHAYGDYDESSMFGYAAGMAIASFYDYYHLETNRVCAHFNEWMTAFGLFYLQAYHPDIATLFTTHATTVGRSIAGNGKPLYDYMSGYFGDQMAAELNVQSKHSAEKAAAHAADCFTTVSGITDRECGQLLEKKADIVTPNGFESGFVPKGAKLASARRTARKALCRVTEALLGSPVGDRTFFIAISGRYEYKNKGIDLYLDVLNRLSRIDLVRPVVAYILVPAWNRGAREDLQLRMAAGTLAGEPLHSPFTTHNLVEPGNDPVLNTIHRLSFTNMPHEKVKVIFVPTYLDGRDGVFNIAYYDLLCGFDLTVFPSYYEPWGYTPMESVAFGVPTITTDLSGFGLWVSLVPCTVLGGIGVAHRTDSNYHEVSAAIADDIRSFMAAMNDGKAYRMVKTKLRMIAESTSWDKFIEYYYRAYAIALRNCDSRRGK
ncbi:MAG: glycogen/starch synthase [bacterium]|uniref:Glycogen/starch synthase n=1 Tax=Candidatus Aphodosoma intestinipullorum TaxID=2840674 RepID=A0A940IFE5_9BACT|nr:glycogen/starch synthase [Candidatus Aphodosoma intestinipullorum]